MASPPPPSRPRKKAGAGAKGEITGGLPADAKKLNLGDAAPDFRRLGIDGKTDPLADFPAQPAPVLMGVFLSNPCPYSQAAETRLIPLVREFAGQGLAVVALNPNRPAGVRLDELGYSTYNDSSEEMKLAARAAGRWAATQRGGRPGQPTAKTSGAPAGPRRSRPVRPRR